MTLDIGGKDFYRIIPLPGDTDRITASVTTPLNQYSAIVAVSPQSVTTPVSTATFEVTGVGPGTSTIEFRWTGPGASGICRTQVTVTGDSSLPASSNANTPTSGRCADPVNTFTGELYFDEPADLTITGPLPLSFRRYYASRLGRDGLITSSLGNNWLHSLEMRLTATAQTAQVIDNHGRLARFVRSGGGWELSGNVETAFQLAESEGGFVFGDPRTNRAYVFDAAGRLISIEDGKGNALALTYSGNRLSQVSDGLGRMLSFSYNSDGNLVRVADGERSVSFEFESGNLVRFTDPLGNTTTYQYDLSHTIRGLLTRKVYPQGNTRYVQTYDSNGRVATQFDGVGNRFTLTYGSGSTIVTDPAGNARRDSHNAAGQMTTHVDESGRTFSFTYDRAGRIATIRDRQNGVTSHAYDNKSGKPVAITQPDGTVTKLSYVSRVFRGVTLYDLSRIEWPDGLTETYTYDAAGNVVSVTDRAGKIWRYAYNQRGQLENFTNPTAGTISYTYDANGRLAAVRDHFGNIERFSYDSSHRLVEIVHADGTSRSFKHDAGDHLVEMTDERGNSSFLTYDRNGNVTSVTDPLGNRTQLAYETRDWLLTFTDPLGKTSVRSYDKLGRLQMLTDKNGNSLTLDYDPVSRLTSVKDQEGKSWTLALNAEGVLSGVTDPLGNRATYGSDALGRITTLTTPLGYSTTLKYDALGWVKEIQDPAGQVTTFSHDPRGRLTKAVYPGAVVQASYSYSDLGKPVRVSDANGAQWRFLYDPLGRAVGAIDPKGNMTSYFYDSRSRVTRVTFPADMGSMDITYDPAGAVTQRQYSDGTVISTTYDKNGRILTTDGILANYDANGRLAITNGMLISRDSEGRIIRLTLGPGRAISYSYNSRGLVTEVRDWLNGRTTFTYDDVGRLKSVTRPNGFTTTYEYDADSRVVEIKESNVSSISLRYDSRGQIVGAARVNPLEANVRSESNRTASYDAASQSAEATYDALGRVVSDSKRAYAWDLASRLVSYTEGGATVTFSYDAAGNRIRRRTADSDRTYVWNYALGVPSISIEREDSNDSRYCVHTPAGILLYSIDAATGHRHFYHFDENGSTLFLTDDNATVTDTYAYSHYGQVIGRTGKTENLFTYAGALGVMEEQSANFTGELYYARARYYDSTFARFLSRDPRINLNPRAFNPYQYTQKNPVGAVDVIGLDRQIIIGGHEWIRVDVYDQNGNVMGQMSLHFAPESGPSSFTLNHPRNDPPYPELITINIESTQLEDELLLLHWQKLSRDPNSQKWTPILNCAWASFTYAYADATELEPAEALRRARGTYIPDGFVSAAPPDPWYTRLARGAGEAWDWVEQGISWLVGE